ncbi:hypothetical protein [Comamonas jiangduensis]|uniref:hypothetical protein n=1 Tax=Comamonas jiangduensis TaxID=1194168 RepID=UPI0028AF4522|nr:hypothetical protein [Comamonas jiangduensis]
MHPIVLGITGDHNTGKTTVAQLLQTHVDARAMAFSDGIYTEVAQAFGCSILELSDRLGKAQPQRLLALQHCTDKAFVQRSMQAHAEGDLQTPRSPRQILEWWGSEYRRSQDADYWVKRTQHSINHYRCHNCHRPIVLADVYKLNEAELIRSLGGTIWRIERPGHEQRTTHATSTEHLQIQADLTLHNMGDIKHLQHLVLTHWHELQRYGHHASAA